MHTFMGKEYSSIMQMLNTALLFVADARSWSHYICVNDAYKFYNICARHAHAFYLHRTSTYALHILFADPILLLPTISSENTEDEIAVPDHFKAAMANSILGKNGTRRSYTRSHGMKRHAVGQLQEHLQPHSFVDRCGFVVRNVHTMFDYFHNTAKQDEESAQTLANWLHKINNTIQGGIPPSPGAIKTASEKFPDFVTNLFRCNCIEHEKTHNT